MTAADIHPSLTTYDLETQQNPVGAIDIIELSKQYILGQIGFHNATNGILTNNTSSLSRKQSRHAKKHISSYNIGMQKRVDGPVQCGPGQPCLNGSCCSKESMLQQGEQVWVQGSSMRARELSVQLRR
jgi:chitinase